MKKITNYEKYGDLLFDSVAMIKASESMIRKKKSRIAIQIKNRNIQTIKKVALSRVHGALNRAQKKKLCRMLCDLKERIKKEKPNQKTIKELVVYIITSIVGLVDATFGLIISLLWIIKWKLIDSLCKCPKAIN